MIKFSSPVTFYCSAKGCTRSFPGTAHFGIGENRRPILKQKPTIPPGWRFVHLNTGTPPDHPEHKPDVFLFCDEHPDERPLGAEE